MIIIAKYCYECYLLSLCVCATVYRKHQVLSNNKESGFTDGNNLQQNILVPQDTASIHNSVHIFFIIGGVLEMTVSCRCDNTPECFATCSVQKCIIEFI